MNKKWVIIGLLIIRLQSAHSTDCGDIFNEKESSEMKEFYKNINKYILPIDFSVTQEPPTSTSALVSTENDHLPSTSYPVVTHSSELPIERARNISPFLETTTSDLWANDSCSNELGKSQSIASSFVTPQLKKSFQCCYCTEDPFQKNPLLTTHIKDKHRNITRPYICIYQGCCDKFTNAGHLLHHQKTHTSPANDPSKIYGKRPNSLSNSFSKPTKQVIAKKIYFRCSYEGCKKKYLHNFSLQKHEEGHTKEDLLKCISCNKRFSRAHNVKRHEKSKKTSRCFSTHSRRQVMNKKYIIIGLLSLSSMLQTGDYLSQEADQEINNVIARASSSSPAYDFLDKEYNCLSEGEINPINFELETDQGIKKTLTESGLIQQDSNNQTSSSIPHTNKSKVSSSPTTLPTFPIELVTTAAQNYQKNKPNSSSLQTNNPSIASSSTTLQLSSNFQCPYCIENIFFTKSKNIALHIRQDHHKKKLFACRYKKDGKRCSKRFKKISDIIHHSCVHTGIKPYKCGICNKRFTRKASLEIHKTSRTHLDVVLKLSKTSK